MYSCRLDRTGVMRLYLWEHVIRQVATVCTGWSFFKTYFGTLIAAAVKLGGYKKVLWRAELISQLFCYSNSSRNITCPSGKLKTEFTSPIAKSTADLQTWGNKDIVLSKMAPMFQAEEDGSIVSFPKWCGGRDVIEQCLRVEPAMVLANILHVQL